MNKKAQQNTVYGCP